jgi:hypothetical protein
MNASSIQPPQNHRFDFQQEFDGMVATVELKKFEGNVTSYWWVSGLNQAGELVNLYQMQLALPRLTEKALEPLVEAMLKDFAFPLAHIASKATGQQSNVQLFDPHFRDSLALAHLRLHDQMGNLDGVDSSVLSRTARAYQLVDSLGVSKAVELLASYENITIHTMRRRLERARNEGLITKKRDERTQQRGAANKPIN